MYWPEIFWLLSVLRLHLSRALHCSTLHTSMARWPHQGLAGASHYGQLGESPEEDVLLLFPNLLAHTSHLDRKTVDPFQDVFFYSLPYQLCQKRVLNYSRILACCLTHPACCSQHHPAHPTNISPFRDHYKPLVWRPWFSRHLHLLKLFSASRAPENLPHMLGQWWGTVGFCQGVQLQTFLPANDLQVKCRKSSIQIIICYISTKPH